MKNPFFPSLKNNFLAEHVCLLKDSYHYLLGKPLLTGNHDYKQAARQLFYAPFALVSHDDQGDPIFNYANLTALELFEFSWVEMMSLPSRLSAERVNRKDRQKLLEEVAAKGFIENYQGIRISKTGKRFQIKNAVVWSMLDSNHNYRGQAAYFKDWTFLD